MTIQEEIALLEIFRDLYADFPTGIIEKSESPDFVVSNKNIRIGIECVEVYQDSFRGKSLLKEKSVFGEKFTDELIELIQKYIPFKFYIGIHFNDEYDYTSKRKRSLIDELTRIAIKELNYLSNKQIVIIEDDNVLPVEIEELQLGRYDEMKNSYNRRPEGGVVYDFDEFHLMSLINKKEDKLDKYQKCDKHWLLIKEGDYFAGSFNNISINVDFKTRFDKVFLLRAMRKELVELK